MSNGLIEVLNHPIRSLIGCFCDHGEFFLCLGENRQAEIDGLAYFLGQRFPLFFRASREALFLFGVQMNECRRH